MIGFRGMEAYTYESDRLQIVFAAFLTDAARRLGVEKPKAKAWYELEMSVSTRVYCIKQTGEPEFETRIDVQFINTKTRNVRCETVAMGWGCSIAESTADASRCAERGAKRLERMAIPTGKPLPVVEYAKAREPAFVMSVPQGGRPN